MLYKRERVNLLLERWRSGEKGAYDELFGVLYEDLREIAHRKLRGERKNHTLQTGDLVSQLYLKMLGSKTIPFEDYGHFLKSSARTMRQILIDHARTWQKRSDGKDKVSIDGELAFQELPQLDGDEAALTQLVALNEAIEKMERVDPQMARVADLKLTLGFTLEEIGEKLGISTSQAKREWLIAKKYFGKAV